MRFNPSPSALFYLPDPWNTAYHHSPMTRQRKTQLANMTDYDSRQYGSPGWPRRHDNFATGSVPPTPSSAPFVNGPITGEPAAYSSTNVQHNHPTVHQYAQPDPKTMQQMPNSYASAEEPESVTNQEEFTNRVRLFDGPALINFTGNLYENRGRQFLQLFPGQETPATANVSSLGQDFSNQIWPWNTIPQQHRQVSFSDNSIQSIGAVHGHLKRPWGYFDGPGPDVLPFETGGQSLEPPTKPSSSWSVPGENTGLKSFENAIDQRRASQRSSADLDPSVNSYPYQHDLSLQSPILAPSHHQGLHQPILTPQTAARSQKRLSSVPGLNKSTSLYPHTRSIGKTKRKRKDETTKTRKLTADGKVHANKVRKISACPACKKSHTKVL